MEEADNRHKESEDQKDDIPTVVLPPYFLKCSRSDLIVLIARMLSSLIHINDIAMKNSRTSSKLTRFHSSTPPDISIYNYMIRLTKYSALEPSVLLASIYYIDLLSSVYPAFTLNSLTAHRFLLTATTVASKGLCDSFCTNAHYAKVGGVQCSELNILESDFLQQVNYRVIPRVNNIKWCKFEHQQQQFTIYDPNITPSDLNQLSKEPPCTYNIIEMYYRKIIQLVGMYNSSSDSTRRVNYTIDTTTPLRVDIIQDKVAQKRPYEPNKNYDGETANEDSEQLAVKKHATDNIRNIIHLGSSSSEQKSEMDRR